MLMKRLFACAAFALTASETLPAVELTRREPVTRDFVAYLKAQPLLKGILAGHYHIDVADRFSPTANEFLVGGNFLFHGQEITIA
jgi:hypothetical protein